MGTVLVRGGLQSRQRVLSSRPTEVRPPGPAMDTVDVRYGIHQCIDYLLHGLEDADNLHGCEWVLQWMRMRNATRIVSQGYRTHVVGAFCVLPGHQFLEKLGENPSEVHGVAFTRLAPDNTV